MSGAIVFFVAIMLPNFRPSPGVELENMAKVRAEAPKGISMLRTVGYGWYAFLWNNQVFLMKPGKCMTPTNLDPRQYISGSFPTE